MDENPAGESHIRRDLQRLYRQGAESKTLSDESVVRDHRGIHDFVAGEYENTSFGDIFVATGHYGWDELHGDFALGTLRKINGDWMSRLGKFPCRSEFDRNGLLFMDTETTGLAGGSGTLAFLIGLAYADDRGVMVKQYFADAYNREEGMLGLVSDQVSEFRNLVSFNGKTYDLPLLESRYIMQRRHSPFAELNHLDLLHPSRQIWGFSLENCRLQTLETEVLGFQRRDDLPGSQVPAAYFRFLQGRGADPLYRVFEHNAHDLLSLVVLLPLVWELSRPGGCTRQAQLPRARILLRHGERDAARHVLEDFVSQGPASAITQQARLELARIYKKDGLWSEAVEQWQAVLAGPAVFLQAYVELAKYFEHRARDCQQALDTTVSGLRKLTCNRTCDQRALLHRIKRLRRKLGEQVE